MIQRRGKFTDFPTNFTKSWVEYKHGFGDKHHEFWLGNDLISEMTSDIQKSVVLRVELQDHDNNRAWAEYSTFRYSQRMYYILWV